MSEIYFGNVALFYSASDTLVDNASYDGKNVQQDQTRFSIMCLRKYFKEHCPGAPASTRSKTVLESNTPSVDDFFCSLE